jgi:hypothetical protein
MLSLAASDTRSAAQLTMMHAPAPGELARREPRPRADLAARHVFITCSGWPVKPGLGRIEAGKRREKPPGNLGWSLYLVDGQAARRKVRFAREFERCRCAGWLRPAAGGVVGRTRDFLEPPRFGGKIFLPGHSLAVRWTRLRVIRVTVSMACPVLNGLKWLPGVTPQLSSTQRVQPKAFLPRRVAL